MSHEAMEDAKRAPSGTQRNLSPERFHPMAATPSVKHATKQQNRHENHLGKFAICAGCHKPMRGAPACCITSVRFKWDVAFYFYHMRCFRSVAVVKGSLVGVIRRTDGRVLTFADIQWLAFHAFAKAEREEKKKRKANAS